MRLRWVWPLLLLCAVLVGCGASTPPPEPATPTPAEAPSATPRPPLSVSPLTLTADDLPPGFEVIPPDELGITAAQLSQPGLTVEGLYGFTHPATGELVIGFAGRITSPEELRAADDFLNAPEQLAAEFLAAFGGEPGTQQPLDLSAGDVSAGFTAESSLTAGVPATLAVFVFRQGEAVALLVTITPADAPQTAPIADLVDLLAARAESTP